MKTAHLHIGSGKTGTTSIQQTFHENREELKKSGFMYPGPNPDHHLLYFASNVPQKDWARTYRGLERDKLQSVINNYFRALSEDLSKDFDQIISTEYLFMSNDEYVKNIVSFLKDYFEKIKVYVFVRDPVGFYRSHQQQILKARSYVASPFSYKYDFKKVIERWAEFFEVEVLEYKKGKDSCEILADIIGVDYSILNKKKKRTKKSVSVEQMALFEKVQRHLYTDIDNQLKGKIHLKTLVDIEASFTHKAQLQEWVKPVVYHNHWEDLDWLKKEYNIDFLNDKLSNKSPTTEPGYQNDKATVRDIYVVEDEESVEKYEALVIDGLLKKLVQDMNRKNK